MLILKLAWKNMWRNRHRTFIVMASVSFAVILSIFTSSLKTGIFDNLVKNLVSYYSGYIQVHKAGYWEERILENSFSHSSDVEKKLRSDLRIQFVSPRLESFALASVGDKTKGCMVLGVSPEQENQITFLKSKVVSGHYLKSDDKSIMIAEGLMKRLGIQINDTVVLIGQGYHGATAAGKYRVGAQLKFGSPDLNDKALFMTLDEAQEFYAAYGIITSYVLALKDLRYLYTVNSTLQAALGSEYEVMTWEQMMPEIKQHIQGDSANMQIVQFILYLLVCFGIFSTMLVMMVERRFEMGMLVAIGMRKMSLAWVLLLESVFTVLSGCILGILLSLPIVSYFHRNPIRIKGDIASAYERFGFEAIFPASTSIQHFIAQGVIVLCIGLLLSMYPVYKALTLDTVKSMKK